MGGPNGKGDLDPKTGEAKAAPETGLRGSVLVVGGGVGAMAAALDLADSGFYVYMVEREPSIGGRMAQLDKTFPTNDCSMCTLAPRLVTTGKHLNIEILTQSELLSLEGEAGDFTAKVRKNPRFVDTDKCTGCAACMEVCPTRVDDHYNEKLQKTRAAHVVFPQAVPLLATIDGGRCIHFKKPGKCEKCVEACGAGAINFDQKPEEVELKVGAVIAAPGFTLFDAEKKGELGFGRFPNVVTSLQYERVLSATGPFEGHITRPSEAPKKKGEHAPKVKKVSWIQCVGSRDVENNFCSSVCCMYATKQAELSIEHEPDIECEIFYIDMRAFSKGFDAYYERAKGRGVRYIRSRPSSVKEDPDTGNLVITYLDEDGTVKTSTTGMLVLSCGLQPNATGPELAKTLGIDLAGDGFCRTEKFTPVETGKKGVYVCGPFTEPKDIPETVTQGSACAAKAMALLADARGTLIQEKTYPPEKAVMEEDPKVGVFICHCGRNIGSVVEVPKVVEFAKSLPNVVVAAENMYTCSQDAMDRMKKDIVDNGVNRVVVSACTPRTHEPLFQEMIREVGLNPYLFEFANIREHCSWVHSGDPKTATRKAMEQTAAAVAKAARLTPLHEEQVPLTKSALVIGGGLAGMTAALDLAGQGYPVHLVEKTDQLGGNLRRLHTTLEGADPQKLLEELVKKVESAELIKVYKSTEIEDFQGFVGNFNARLKIGERKERTDVRFGVAIAATGGSEVQETIFGYGTSDKVMTQLELEDKLHGGKLDPKGLKEVVMIQCAGSRTKERPYCSRLCCSEAIKNALKIKEANPEAAVYVLYRDIRTYGFKEAYYREAREKGVIFLRYDAEQPPTVETSDRALPRGNAASTRRRGAAGALGVKVGERTLGLDVALEPDIVVLSTGTQADESTPAVSRLLKVPLSADGFYLEAHMKLRPVDFGSDGFFMAGLGHYPKTIDETMAQASAASSRAATILSKAKIKAKGIVVSVKENICSGCGVCVDACPYGARSVDEMVRKAAVEEAVCQGCGSCAVACPNGATQQRSFRTDQIMSMVHALLTEERAV